ncbi:SAM-dependent methyltransferase [Actinomadura sp. NPDC047616]|uniref:SAM-dependent methyltransferase n=1 Tax=Actinomadura sp. NPDC047616 TaxID=3155914 RepID=UPI0033F362E5
MSETPLRHDAGPIRDPGPTMAWAAPSIARVVDCLLGGKDNFRADRERAAEALAADPRLRQVVVENRRFSRRAVRYLARECGVRQFVDIGTGLPAAENTHDIAQDHDASAQVLYVDNDPIVVAHGQALLAENDRIGVVQADLRDPGALLDHPVFTRLIDLDEPVAVLLTPVLQFLSDADRPEEVMRTVRDALPPASHLVLSHACPEACPERVERVMDVYRSVVPSATARERERIAGFFGDFEFAEPGLTWVSSWRPDIAVPPRVAERVWQLGGVARKPGPAAGRA